MDSVHPNGSSHVSSSEEQPAPSDAQTRSSEEQELIASPPTTPKTSACRSKERKIDDVRSRTTSNGVPQCQRSPVSPVPIGSPSHQCQDADGYVSHRSKSQSISSNSSDMLLDDFPEDDNRTREQEMWAMLAGQTSFKFQSYIFQRVLPKSLIKPHIFPRNVEDMETLIEKYSTTGKLERLEGAAEKWAALKSQWKWRKAYGLVIGTAKSAYLHISNPLEVMMKLDREKGDNLEDARRSYRNVLPPNLQEPGQEVVDIMHCIGLLTDKSSPPSPR